MNEKMKNEIVEEIGSMLEVLKGGAEKLREMRELVYKAQTDYDKKNRELQEFVAEWTIESATTDPELDKPVDPRTGRTNQDWTQLLTEAKLAENAEYIKLREDLFVAQEVLLSARHEIEIITDSRATIGLEIRLLEVLAKVEGLWMSENS